MLLKASLAFISASLFSKTTLAHTFIGPPINVDLGSAIGAGAAFCGMAYISGKAVMSMKRRRRRSESPSPNIDELLPFLRIDSGNQSVISERADYGVEGRKSVGKYEVRFAVIELGGMDYASTSPDTIETFRRSRLAWQSRLAESEIAVTVIVDRHLFDVTMARDMDNEWLREVNTRWSEHFENAFSNTTSLMLIDEGTGDLASAIDATMTLLRPAKPRLLQHHDAYMFNQSDIDQPVPYANSELWSFVYSLVNSGFPVRRLLSPQDLPQSLKGVDYEFDESTGSVRLCDGISERFQKYVVLPKIERERVEANSRVFRRLMMLDHEIMPILISRPREGSYSKKKLAERKANRDIKNAGLTKTMNDDFQSMHEDFDEGADGFTETEVIIRVQGESLDAVNRAASAVIGVWTEDDNFRASVATKTVVNEWERILPGAGMPIRQMNLGRGGFAEWTPFAGTPHGLDKCWWGPHALRVVKTIDGGAYHLGVHEHAGDEALGNAALIGKPGSGKSVTASWMITGALSYFPDMRVFCFDNLHGLAVPTKAFGGVVVTPGVSSFAPLQMEDTSENRTLIVQLLMEMAGTDKREDQEEIEQGLDLVMPLDIEGRTLDNFLIHGLHNNSDIHHALRSWVGSGAFAGWMDGDRDSLNLKQARWITFDMSRLLPNPRILSVYMAYVMHRIKTECWDGPPQSHIIFIDEAPTMFAASKMMMQTGEYLARNIRKKKGAVWFAFQDAEGLGEAGSVIISSCATMAFWRNPSLDKDLYRSSFNLSDSDIRFIADEDESISHLERVALFIHKTTRGQESTPVNVHLGALGELMCLFKAGEESVDLMNACIREFGEENQRWVRPYIERSRSMH
jgi:type IV secretory pathway VirB4 component